MSAYKKVNSLKTNIFLHLPHKGVNRKDNMSNLLKRGKLSIISPKITHFSVLDSNQFFVGVRTGKVDIQAD